MNMRGERALYFFSVVEADAEGRLRLYYPGESLDFAQTLTEATLDTAVLVRLRR